MRGQLSRAIRYVGRQVVALPDRFTAVGPFSNEGDPDKPKLMVNSIPKSGTHLMGKLADMLGFRDLNVHQIENAYWDHNRRGNYHSWDALEGYTEYANPRLVRQSPKLTLRRMLRGQYLRAHINRVPATVAAIRKADVKQVFMYRDPRDVVVSHVQLVTNRPDRSPPKKRHEYFARVLENDEQRIQAVIKGVPGILLSMNESLFNGKVEWLSDPETCCVRFEDLIGPQGGGSHESQRNAIQRILNYLQIPETDELYERILDDLFGGQTHTFNKGQIGTWRQVFTEEHIQSFKEVAGDLLPSLGYDDWS
jgi:hypothetical protein